MQENPGENFPEFSRRKFSDIFPNFPEFRNFRKFTEITQDGLTKTTLCYNKKDKFLRCSIILCTCYTEKGLKLFLAGRENSPDIFFQKILINLICSYKTHIYIIM